MGILQDRLKIAVEDCVATHHIDDIVEHLEEECLELLLEIKRFKRGKGTFQDLLEEVIDVSTEITTFEEMLESQYEKIDIDKIRNLKYTKFEKMLSKERAEHPKGYIISRYKSFKKKLERYIESI